VTNIAVRIGLVVFAGFVLAWLAVGLRAVVLEDRADAVLERTAARTASPEEVHHAERWLDQAAKLNPDRGPDLKKVRLLHEVGRDRDTLGITTQVVADEPENLDAWYLIYATDHDPARRSAALARMRGLNPYIEVLIGRRECIKCPLRRQH
jgi:hypothetical protein